MHFFVFVLYQMTGASRLYSVESTPEVWMVTASDVLTRARSGRFLDGV